MEFFRSGQSRWIADIISQRDACMNSGLRSATPTPVHSPCVEGCKMDPATRLCPGCCRTRKERDWWVAYSGTQQRDVLQGCDQRKLFGPFLTKL
jgi:predicted Fe-S protein YdhL (DUF1289 family)